MRFSAADKKFCRKLKDGLEFMAGHEPPYLIHCEAGMDRTGFLAIMLEAFMGAKFDDIVMDYMLSFVDKGDYSTNYYKDGAIFTRNLFSNIKGEPIADDEDLRIVAVKYFAEYVGLGIGELNRLEIKLNRELK
jgi:protein tyrosine/serine phosphatase